MKKRYYLYLNKKEFEILLHSMIGLSVNVNEYLSQVLANI